MPDTALTAEESYNILVAQVHAPVFFEKLARVYGISSKTQEEARELLLMAGELRNAHEQETVKVANASTNFLSQARTNLNKTLASQGYSTLDNPNVAVKTAAEHAAQNPLLKEAALVFNSYVNSTLQGN